MLDIHTRPARGGSSPIVRGVEFFRIELSPLADGKVCVALTATTVDEDEPQLLDQEIARNQVASIDDVIALIRTHVNITKATGATDRPRLS